MLQCDPQWISPWAVRLAFHRLAAGLPEWPNFTGSSMQALEQGQCSHARTCSIIKRFFKKRKMFSVETVVSCTQQTDLRRMKRAARNGKTTWQVYSFGKRNVYRLHVNESREGSCRRGRGRSFHVDGPKTEKARKPTVCMWLTRLMVCTNQTF